MSSNNASGSDIPDSITPDLWAKWMDLQRGCYPDLIDGVDPTYGYRPTLGAGIAFDVLFGICVIGHLIQLIRFRRWTSGLMMVGAITEVIGWAGRTWSAKCPYNNDAFLMQITTLIIAPTFFAAALYVLLGMLIRLLGRQTSILSAKWYAIVFCTCDVISLVIQAVGGGMAAGESDKQGGDTKPGTHTMVAGIAFQLFTMTVFAALVLDFLRRVYKLAKGRSDGQGGLTRNMKLTLLALFVSFVMIYIRSVYRTVELAQGWSGYLITHEGYFIGLDGSLMVVSAGIFLVFDPAVLLRDEVKKVNVSGKEEYGTTTGDDSEAQSGGVRGMSL
ncbi:RTA1 like protein-domain-containing protein [Pseudoneurospora amorphoporcata]|uniref:RTA1 like protein-domain-containing protein n=1 Tax=Pseudoneurospora amorphoporcata TaxID=241081 RepID=A0AAN6NKM5_9PEZI|nr:RTA1 like protein-domain-containing protein [Pseudoneurospora amorphoporcata]